jgi:16S rRNA (guanine1207-N2)-methyltransferase
MRSARLDLALHSGAFALPATGRIAVWRPVMGDDLGALARDRVTMLTGFKPDHDHFAGLGFAVTPSPPYAAGMVCLPRAKALTHALVWQAMTQVSPGGPVLLDGQKTDGIDSLIKDLRAAGVTLGEPQSKAHGKFVTLAAGQALPGDWVGAPHAVEDGFWTAPGVFSAEGADAGSVLLAAHLPEVLPSRVADLGAGWGYLTRAILAKKGVKVLDAVEAEAAALDCARRAVDDPRVSWHWADARTFRPVSLWGAVVMNPPFHTGRAAEPDLGLAFIAAAHRGLAPDGQLWMVANRQLPYEKALASLFRKVQTLAQGPVHKVIHAAGPIRAPR